YLQKGQFAPAREMVDACSQKTNEDAVEMRVLYQMSGGTFDAVPLSDTAPASAKFGVAYGEAIAAAQRGDQTALSDASTRLHALAKQLGTSIGQSASMPLM